MLSHGVFLQSLGSLNESYAGTADYLSGRSRHRGALVTQDSGLCRHRQNHHFGRYCRVAAQRKFLYLVFNRAAAEEAELKMPSNVRPAPRTRWPSAASVISINLVWRAALGLGFPT